jgi:hypothetical protein
MGLVPWYVWSCGAKVLEYWMIFKLKITFTIVNTLVQLHQQLWAYVMLGPLGYVTYYFVLKIYIEKSRSTSTLVCYILQEFYWNVLSVVSHPTCPRLLAYYCTPMLWFSLLSKVCMTLLPDVTGLEFEPCPTLYDQVKSQQQQHW